MPVHADPVGVSPCSIEVGPGSYTPALHVKQNGISTIYPVGYNGLTPSIISNRAAAFEWVRANLGLPDDTYLRDFHNFVCGILNEEPDPVPYVYEPDEEDEDGEACAAEGCDYEY